LESIDSCDVAAVSGSAPARPPLLDEAAETVLDHVARAAAALQLLLEGQLDALLAFVPRCW
jgi:hypothetical protein